MKNTTFKTVLSRGIFCAVLTLGLVATAAAVRTLPQQGCIVAEPLMSLQQQAPAVKGMPLFSLPQSEVQGPTEPLFSLHPDGKKYATETLFNLKPSTARVCLNPAQC